MYSKQAILQVMLLHSWLIIIYEVFEKNEYTLGVFIDLFKAFDTVDQPILLMKLELYGITDRNYARIKSYLSNRLQYIELNIV